MQPEAALPFTSRRPQRLRRSGKKPAAEEMTALHAVVQELKGGVTVRSTQRNEIESVFVHRGLAMSKHRHEGSNTIMSRVSKPVSLVLISATAAAITLLSAAAPAADKNKPMRLGNGPGPAANGPGPGCNLIPPEASIGTRVDISEFPP